MKFRSDMPGDILDLAPALEGPGPIVTHLNIRDSALWQLIERARQGDAAAFDGIMIRYQRRVVGTAWRMLGDREDARDAAQEVFFRVFKYLKSYRSTEDFEGWLYRIILNVCRDAFRKRPPAATAPTDWENRTPDSAGFA